MNRPLSPQIALIVVIAACAAACTRSEAPSSQNTQRVFQRYIEAANQHDLELVRAITAEDAIWYLGPDTLIGREEVLRPLAFDEGVHTMLEASNVVARGDTIDFDLLERNDVLEALGIAELHHFPRFVFRDGLIYRILARRPPRELEAFADSVMTFAQWLRVNKPAAYDQLWPEGRFSYGRSAGEVMPSLIYEWKSSRE